MPGRVILLLVLAGLRVRLSRSVVTMATVVLAIAFLTYMGMTGRLTYNLAVLSEELAGVKSVIEAAEGQPDGVALTTLLRRAGVNIESTLQGGIADTWVIIMALMLCTVGIANAMLMSVTERFREIGTMKCLGAQDSLVVKLFLLESAFLGIAGAVMGILLGLGVTLAAGWLQFGGYVFAGFPIREGINVMGLALLAGILLAVVGTLYPAVLAARMKPVDALRIDE